MRAREEEIVGDGARILLSLLACHFFFPGTIASLQVFDNLIFTKVSAGIIQQHPLLVFLPVGPEKYILLDIIDVFSSMREILSA